MPKSGKNSQMSGSEQALEPAVVEVENAAEVVRLATVAAFGKWRDDRKVQLTKTKRLAVRLSRAVAVLVPAK
jgi:diacylglycerol kinase family enzyme